jgi:hypothetical protein
MAAMDTQQRTGANLAGLRDHNAALVLALLRSAPRGSSRVELAEQTGLTPQAISKIITRLLTESLVDEAGRGPSTGGKPRTLLRLRPEAGCAVGVELDRQQTTVLLADLAGSVRHRSTLPLGLASAAPQEVVAQVAAQVREAAAAAPAEARVLGVGVGCRGPLDHAAGVLHRPAGLPAWDRFPLRDTLTAALDRLPVRIDKDTNVAALGEAGPGGAAYLHFADGLGAGLCWTAPSTAGRAPTPASSATRWCSLTARPAVAANAAAWRHCAWPRSPTATPGRRPGSWAWAPPTWCACWTSTGCCSADGPSSRSPNCTSPKSPRRSPNGCPNRSGSA